MMEKTDHDILIRVESKVESLTDEVRLMRDGTKENINKLFSVKLDHSVFDEHVRDTAKILAKHSQKLDTHDKLIYIGLGIVLTLQFAILVIKS